MSTPAGMGPGGGQGVGVGVLIDLEVKNDVETELSLHKLPGAMTTLEFLAGRGGEVPWDWAQVSPKTREVVADMILAGVVKEIEYVTHAAQVSGRLALRLTDKGQNVIAIHGKRTITQKGLRLVTVEEVADLQKVSGRA